MSVTPTRRVIHVTTRILVVDLLRELADPRRVEGVVILNAHKVTEECGEAFAVRLLRAGNARLFVRAFTDSAVGVSSGFNRVRRRQQEVRFSSFSFTSGGLLRCSMPL